VLPAADKTELVEAAEAQVKAAAMGVAAQEAPVGRVDPPAGAASPAHSVRVALTDQVVRRAVLEDRPADRAAR
jgi:hypothetical protein